MRIKKIIMSLCVLIITGLFFGTNVNAIEVCQSQTIKGVTVKLDKIENDNDSLRLYVTYINNSDKEIATGDCLSKIVVDRTQYKHDSDFNFKRWYKKNIPHADDYIEKGVTQKSVIFFPPVKSDKINVILYANWKTFKFEDIHIKNSQSNSSKTKDIKDLKIEKVEDYKDVEGLTDVSIEDFFKKVNSDKEEQLIKNIALAVNPNYISIVKNEQNRYCFSVIKYRNSDLYDNSAINFYYCFNNDDSLQFKYFEVENYGYILPDNGSKDSNNITKDLLNYVGDVEVMIEFSDIQLKCCEIESKNVNNFVYDNVNKKSNIYYNDKFPINEKYSINAKVESINGKISNSVGIVINK